MIFKFTIHGENSRVRTLCEGIVIGCCQTLLHEEIILSFKHINDFTQWEINFKKREEEWVHFIRASITNLVKENGMTITFD